VTSPRGVASRACALALLLVMLQSAATRAADEDPLEFALAPYISVRPLMAMFQPLASYLEERLKRPVLLVTAPSLREFDERVLARSYELAMTAPHTARLAQKEAGYVPLLRMSNDLYGVFLVPAGSSARSLKDMAGESIAFPDRFTATAQLGKEALHGFGADVAKIVYPPGFQDSLLTSLVRGEIPVLLMNSSAFYQMREEQKAGVRVVGETRHIPHVMFLARSDMSAQRQSEVRTAISEFMEQSVEGKKFIAQTGLTGVRPPTEAELRSLDSLAQEHKHLLEEARAAGGASR
jgi:phosphonate transport system substrate-binding protein